MRLDLDTFDIADQATCAYDAAAWCLRQPRREMNFPEVMTLEWAQRLAPSLRVITKEDYRQYQRRERCLGIADMEEHAMAVWRQ
ncbi:Ethylene-responsive transcription factor CRF1 [Hordeum vulgare]|nr:Ethylene-responsive transcription factor CRF1 [Hordeum vulgare]